MSNPYIGTIDSSLSGATTPRQSGPGSDGNEGILRIPQSSSITGVSPSDCLVPYPRHSLGGVFTLCRDAIGVFYSPNRLAWLILTARQTRIIFCQEVRELHSEYVHIYIFFCTGFCQIRLIFKPICLTHRYNPHMYYFSGSEWTWE